jgi:hypothetical protein
MEQSIDTNAWSSALHVRQLDCFNFVLTHSRFFVQSFRLREYSYCVYWRILSSGTLARPKITAEQPRGMSAVLGLSPSIAHILRGSMPTSRSLKPNFLHRCHNPKTSCRMARVTISTTVPADGASCLFIRPFPFSRVKMPSFVSTTSYGRWLTSRTPHVTKFNSTSLFNPVSRPSLLYGASSKRKKWRR